MKRGDFTPGRSVYLFELRNFDRNGTIENRIKEVKIKSVGRKYVTVEFWGGMKFDMTKEFRQVTDYSPMYALYLTKDDIYKAIRRADDERKLLSAFNNLRIIRQMTDEDFNTLLAIVSKYLPEYRESGAHDGN